MNHVSSFAKGPPCKVFTSCSDQPPAIGEITSEGDLMFRTELAPPNIRYGKLRGSLRVAVKKIALYENTHRRHRADLPGEAEDVNVPQGKQRQVG